jgi:hypothetical protein
MYIYIYFRKCIYIFIFLHECIYIHEYVGTKWTIVLVDREGEINKKIKNDKKKSGPTQGFSQGIYIYLYMCMCVWICLCIYLST